MFQFVKNLFSKAKWDDEYEVFEKPAEPECPAVEEIAHIKEELARLTMEVAGLRKKVCLGESK